MRSLITLLLFGSLGLAGCQFAAGAATGALATGAGYEINSRRQIDRLEDDYRASASVGASIRLADTRSNEARSFTESGPHQRQSVRAIASQGELRRFLDAQNLEKVQEPDAANQKK